MSIPKEPRQLMINIMYLVLMALLALNVSAEVMNAFQTLDEGNQNSIATVDEQLEQTVTGLDELLSDASKQEYRVIQPAVAAVQDEVTSFNNYIDGIRDQLVDMAGNNNGELDDDDYKMDHGVLAPRGKKNKDVTTRLLVLGPDGEGGDPGVGEEIKERIVQTRARLEEIFSNLLEEHGREPFGLTQTQVQSAIESVVGNMPFGIDDEAWQEADRDSWSDFKFGHMPVAAVLPLMSQMQSDLKVSEANIINAMAGYAGGRTIEFDKFFPVFEADRSYVIGGERLTAQVSVGSYSSTLDPSNIDLRVNGQRLTVGPDGKADFSTVASGSGPKTLNLTARVVNPLTGEVDESSGKFTYEVGRRSVAVSADKMNVFYIGVDNPVTVSAAGVPSSDVRVSVSGAASRKSGNNTSLVVTGQRQGEATISVSAKGQSLGSFPFRVKRIPDPVPQVAGERGGAIGASSFKAQRGMIAKLENFDFDARCNIAGFEMVYVPNRGDALVSANASGTYTSKSSRLASQARPGDRYFFNNIRGRCPGDKGNRKLGTMAFTIR